MLDTHYENIPTKIRKLIKEDILFGNNLLLSERWGLGVVNFRY